MDPLFGTEKGGVGAVGHLAASKNGRVPPDPTDFRNLKIENANA